MSLLSNQAPGGGAAAAVSCTHHCSLKFTNPNPPLFSNHRRPPKHPTTSTNNFPKPLTVANAEPSSRPTASTSGLSAATDTTKFNFNGEDNIPFTLVREKDVPLEGVIQFEMPNSSPFASLISKWGWVAFLACGDVLALLLFSAIERFSHGVDVFVLETLKTADPFMAGWFLSAYILGGYGEDGRGMNGWSKALTAAGKSWALGIPLGLMITAATVGHIPPANFILVTMGSTGVLLVGWRALLFNRLSQYKSKKNNVYRCGSPVELFELLTSLVRRW